MGVTCDTLFHIEQTPTGVVGTPPPHLLYSLAVAEVCVCVCVCTSAVLECTIGVHFFAGIPGRTHQDGLQPLGCVDSPSCAYTFEHRVLRLNMITRYTGEGCIYA